MELIKSAARRTRVSEIIYTFLNVAYAALLLVLILEFSGQPYLAYLVVILSKWRALAVRPRFWVANIRTNLLDMLVGLSVVTLLWQNTGHMVVQIVITVLFALWLVLLKPLSKRRWIIIQAGIAQFVGVMALFFVAHTIPSTFVVLLAWLIGFMSARHIVNSYNNEYEDVTMSAIWGVVLAEIAWLMHHWTIAYTTFNIPQISIIITLLGYAALVVYDYLYHGKSGRAIWSSLSMPILFAIAGVALLLIFFNGFDPTSM